MSGSNNFYERVNHLNRRIKSLFEKYNSIRNNDLKKQFPSNYVGQIRAIISVLDLYNLRPRDTINMGALVTIEARILRLESLYNSKTGLSRPRAILPLPHQDLLISQQPERLPAGRRRRVEIPPSEPLQSEVYRLYQDAYRVQNRGAYRDPSRQQSERLPAGRRRRVEIPPENFPREEGEVYRLYGAEYRVPSRVRESSGHNGLYEANPELRSVLDDLEGVTQSSSSPELSSPQESLSSAHSLQQHSSDVLPKIPEDSIRLAADFEVQLRNNDTMQRFRDVYFSEFIEDPIYFIGNEEVIFEKNSIESAIASLELAKTNYKKLIKLQRILQSDSDDATYPFQQTIAYLKRDDAFIKHIEETGSQVLGNCSVQDIIHLDLEKLKQILKSMNLMDVLKELNIMITNRSISINYIYTVALFLFYNLIAQVELSTRKSANDVLRNPTNREPLDLEKLKSARLFMDVYLVAMHHFRQQQSKYEEWRSQQITKDEDYLVALEAAIKELTEDGECKDRFTAATKSLEICAKYYQQERGSGKAIEKKELEQLIKESGLTYSQLKILKADGVIQLTMPEQRASPVEVVRRKRR